MEEPDQEMEPVDQLEVDPSKKKKKAKKEKKE